MLDSSVYELTQDLQGALFQAGMALQPEPLPPSPNVLLQLRRGYAESPAWFLVQATEFDPEPLSVQRLRRRAVWSSERIVVALLDLMVSEKWLDRSGEDYSLTGAGREVIEGVLERRYKILAPLLTQLDSAEVSRLERLLRRVLDAALKTPAPPDNWSLLHSRHRAPQDDAPDVHKLFQYGADFNACRDDAHMAAFQPLGVSAFVGEAFSLIWHETANTPEALFNELPYRGYSRVEYFQAIGELRQRGWVTPDDNGGVHITDAGRAVRETAERQTNAYFFSPWKCLAEDEISELLRRMTNMKDHLLAIK